MKRKYDLIVLIALILGVLFFASCSKDDTSKVELKMASLSEMPAEVRQAPVNVQKAYQFNLANSEIMEQIPCYCGCGPIGHHSNFNCYAKFNADGSTTLDGHALGCSICVDITLDTMRLLEQGKSIPEIQEYVDSRYSQYGPPTSP